MIAGPSVALILHQTLGTGPATDDTAAGLSLVATSSLHLIKMIIAPWVFSTLDMARTATNAIGNALACTLVAKWEGDLKSAVPERRLGDCAEDGQHILFFLRGRGFASQQL